MFRCGALGRHLGQLFHPPFHVRLPGAEPDFSGEHVLDGDRIVALQGQGMRATCLWGLQLDHPFSGGIGGGRRAFSPAAGDAYLFPCVCRAPDGCLDLALDDHVIGEECRWHDIR